MKYRTVIELICEAADKEDASNIAGDYLKGDVDFGVEMKCRTASLRKHRAKKYGLSCLFVCFLFLAIFLQVTPIANNVTVRSGILSGINGTYAIMPELKTKTRSDFKKEWHTSKNKVMLDYLKK